MLDLDYIDTYVSGPLGRALIYKEHTGSTNEDISNLATLNVPEGLTVLANHQSAGRGRRGAHWQDAPEGMILMSVLLRPQCALQDHCFLTYMAAWAVCKAIDVQLRLHGCDAQWKAWVKWPNDVFLSPRKSDQGGLRTSQSPTTLQGYKVAGVLLEGETQGQTFCNAALGIGVNVNTPKAFFEGHDELKQACSLLSATGKTFKRELLIVDILNEINAVYADFKAEGRVHFMHALLKRLHFSQQQRIVYQGQSVAPLKLFADGSLAVKQGKVQEVIGRDAFAF